MINRVVLVGRMTRDPELRRTQQGDAVTSFTLAVNRNFTSGDGQRQADFINCVVWRKPAENVERYCSKGSLVGVEGKIQTRTYDDKDGKTVFVVEVRCDSMQFLDTRNQMRHLWILKKFSRWPTIIIFIMDRQVRVILWKMLIHTNIMEEDIQF